MRIKGKINLLLVRGINYIGIENYHRFNVFCRKAIGVTLGKGIPQSL